MLDLKNRAHVLAIMRPAQLDQLVRTDPSPEPVIWTSGPVQSLWIPKRDVHANLAEKDNIGFP